MYVGFPYAEATLRLTVFVNKGHDVPMISVGRESLSICARVTRYSLTYVHRLGNLH
jgi:hypothetical protein